MSVTNRHRHHAVQCGCIVAAQGHDHCYYCEKPIEPYAKSMSGHRHMPIRRPKPSSQPSAR